MVLDKYGFKEEPQEIITDLEKIGVRSDEINVADFNKDIQKIVLQLKETIRANNITGLSAPQIGVMKRIFCINFNGDIRTFINPMITKVSGLQIVKETCASIPGKTFIRPRHTEIEATYSTPLGKIEARRFLGASAQMFQHLVDHLDGMLLPDVGLEVDDDFLNASEEEQEKVVNLYMDSLDIRRKEVNSEIEKDEDLKKTSDAIDFLTKVQKGEVELDFVPTPKKEDATDKD